MELCDGRMCTLVRDFEPSSQARLQDQLNSYLSDHGAAKGIEIGTLDEIKTRTKCPLCTFTLADVSASAFATEPGASQCFAVVEASQDAFRVRIMMPGEDYKWDTTGLGNRNVLIESEPEPSPMAGRMLRPDGVNYELIKRWIDLCAKSHEAMCRLSIVDLKDRRTSTPEKLRVIDVRNNCLADIPWDTRYLALSYVWGRVIQLKLYRKELREFYAPGSLTSKWERIPQTIQDAMEFTRGLCVQYLWVDALCLVQDAGPDVSQGVMNMDLIYERAHVTIIAAEGDSANAGLPGVAQTPRYFRQMTTQLKPGLTLMRVQSLDSHLNKSVWATRGWTLQEQYLSRRTIAFVDGRMFFRCRSRVWSEETWRDRDPSFQLGNDYMLNYIALAQEAMDDDGGYGTPFEYLWIAVNMFQRRNLTNEEDALKAMAGITQRVGERAKTTMLAGLPRNIFPLAVLFNLALAGPWDWMTRRNQFPSWSWAGWRGYQLWYGTDRLQPFKGPEDYDDALSITVAYFRAYSRKEDAWKCEVIWVPNFTYLASVWPDIKRPEENSLLMTTEQESAIESENVFPILVVSSITVTASIGGRAGVDYEQNTCTLYDVSRKPCGQVALDVDIERDKNTLHAFLVVSVAHKRRDMSVPGSKDAYDELPPAVWALLIVRVRGGLIWERRGLALIHQEYVEECMRAGTGWSTVLLG